MYTIVLLSQKIKLFDLTWLEYADDTYLIVCASKRATIMAELNHISTWAAQNNLRLNANKSREMLIRRSSNFEFPPTIAGVERVTLMKILGVTVSDNLRATDHVAEVISSCSRGLYALLVLRSHGLSDISLHAVTPKQRLLPLCSILRPLSGASTRLRTGINSSNSWARSGGITLILFLYEVHRSYCSVLGLLLN